LEFDGLAFLQRAVAATLNGREVDEDVLATLELDETVPFAVVEPFDTTSCHEPYLRLMRGRLHRNLMSRGWKLRPCRTLKKPRGIGASLGLFLKSNQKPHFQRN